jgi:hypothetical protein
MNPLQLCDSPLLAQEGWREAPGWWFKPYLRSDSRSTIAPFM